MSDLRSTMNIMVYLFELLVLTLFAGNILQSNLAIMVRPSTSLVNVDITPAAFLITHPTNDVRENHAAAGTHYAFW